MSTECIEIDASIAWNVFFDIGSSVFDESSGMWFDVWWVHGATVAHVAISRYPKSIDAFAAGYSVRPSSFSDASSKRCSHATESSIPAERSERKRPPKTPRSLF